MVEIMRKEIQRKHKKKNGQGFIRFYPVTRELCEEVLKYKQSADLESFVNKNDNKIN